MLDFVNPERAGRRSHRLRRQARLDEAGRSLHDHGRAIVVMLPPRDPLCLPRVTMLSASSGTCSALASLSRGIYRSRTIRAVSKPLQLVRSRTDQPSLA